MADKALSVPPNTSELMELGIFVKKAESEMSFNLEDRLREILKYISFLSDYKPLTSVEIKTNNFAFQWYIKEPPIIYMNKTLKIENKKIYAGD